MDNEQFGTKLTILENAEIFQAPKIIEHTSTHYEVIIGIGNDHTATLYIDEDALEELRKNPINYS